MKKGKRMGRVYVNAFYVVDLDDPDMVEEAKNALFEDLMNSVKYDELYDWIEDTEDETMKEEDICEFLKGEEDEEWQKRPLEVH